MERQDFNLCTPQIELSDKELDIASAKTCDGRLYSTNGENHLQSLDHSFNPENFKDKTP